ncbi:MAG: SDR family oxidoreductase [Acidobacteria bacterium]|nr:SDR family oxidoreductase [Acidobacteriota bacterium]
MARVMDGHTVMVTGGGRGIGRAIALAFADAGARVAVASRTTADVERVAADLLRAGSEAMGVACDVTEAPSVAAAVGAIERRFGAIDVLVNNAGMAESAPLVEVTDASWARTLAVNLTGTFLCTRAVLPGMLALGWGRVINIASVAGRVGFRYSTAYCAAKHGVLGLTRALALETARRGVTVNAVCPGWVDTDMTIETIDRIAARTGRTRDEARAALERMSPQERLVAPDEVAAVALFLAGPSAAGLTGQALNVDGGEVMS